MQSDIGYNVSQQFSTHDHLLRRDPSLYNIPLYLHTIYISYTTSHKSQIPMCKHPLVTDSHSQPHYAVPPTHPQVS